MVNKIKNDKNKEGFSYSSSLCINANLFKKKFKHTKLTITFLIPNKKMRILNEYIISFLMNNVKIFFEKKQLG